jgi:hypothetical protein
LERASEAVRNNVRISQNRQGNFEGKINNTLDKLDESFAIRNLRDSNPLFRAQLLTVNEYSPRSSIMTFAVRKFYIREDFITNLLQTLKDRQALNVENTSIFMRTAIELSFPDAEIARQFIACSGLSAGRWKLGSNQAFRLINNEINLTAVMLKQYLAREGLLDSIRGGRRKPIERIEIEPNDFAGIFQIRVPIIPNDFNLGAEGNRLAVVRIKQNWFLPDLLFQQTELGFLKGLEGQFRLRCGPVFLTKARPVPDNMAIFPVIDFLALTGVEELHQWVKSAAACRIGSGSEIAVMLEEKDKQTSKKINMAKNLKYKKSLKKKKELPREGYKWRNFAMSSYEIPFNDKIRMAATEKAFYGIVSTVYRDSKSGL